MNALVTGATGFIGSHLVDALIKRGYTVTCLARKTSNLKWIEHLDIKYTFCDLADIESYRDKIDNYDYVFHLAGLTKAVSGKDFFSANAENTKKLLEIIADRNSKIKRFIFLSSLAAVGPSGDGNPISEDLPPKPVSMYGKSKLEGENAVMGYKDRIPITIIRSPAVYGPRDSDFLLLFKLINKGISPYWGKCYYSLLYVEDLVQGIILSAEKHESEGKVFFLSNGMLYSNEDIVREISLVLNSKVIRLKLPRSMMHFLAFIVEKLNKKGIMNRDKVKELYYSNWTCDATQAKEELGFNAKITLREGIKWTADWYKIHQWL
jgi:nucleoside-diphosphate-sugar epimerase